MRIAVHKFEFNSRFVCLRFTRVVYFPVVLLFRDRLVRATSPEIPDPPFHPWLREKAFYESETKRQNFRGISVFLVSARPNGRTYAGSMSILFPCLAASSGELVGSPCQFR